MISSAMVRRLTLVLVVMALSILVVVLWAWTRFSTPSIATGAATGSAAAMSNSRGPISGMDSRSTYAVYYGNPNQETMLSLQAFDLVILHPDSGVTVTEVEELQAASVIVLGYVSIGEEPPGLLHTDTMSGPVHHEAGGDCCGVENRHCEYNGYACYYLDEDGDREPDTRQDGPWGSHFVDPASPYWREKIGCCNKDTMTDCSFYGTDYVLNTLGCDGLFLDTVDTASPWHPYSYTLDAMADLICTISDRYPDQYVVLNRGIFYADPSYGADVVRPCINGIVFEGYCSVWDWELNEGRVSPWFEDNRDIWAPKLNAQCALTDGCTVFALDYFTPTQQISIAHQISETVERWGWLEYISTPYLDTVRWEVWAYLHRRVYLPVVHKGYSP